MDYLNSHPNITLSERYTFSLLQILATDETYHTFLLFFLGIRWYVDEWTVRTEHDTRKCLESIPFMMLIYFNKCGVLFGVTVQSTRRDNYKLKSRSPVPERQNVFVYFEILFYTHRTSTNLDRTAFRRLYEATEPQ